MTFYTMRPLFTFFLCCIFCINLPLFAAIKALDPDEKSITLAITNEPPKLNSIISTDATSFMLLDHLTEGLMGYDQNGKLTGGVAEKWQLTEKKAHFWLKRNALWNDGKPVTAHDFITAWREVLKPETASAYAFILYPIANAETINQGKLPPTALGVKAINDYELEIILERPTPYFLELTAFNTYRPIRADALAKWGRAYAADADKMLFNGPFILTEWTHGASLSLEKNTSYWNANAVNLEHIHIPYLTSDSTALFNLFLEERIATWIRPAIGANDIKKALKKHLEMKKFQNGAVWYLEFNHRPDRITSNLNLRKAIQSFFDPVIFANKVIGNPGNKPTYSIFPSWLKGAEKKLAEEYPPKIIHPNLETAKYYLEKAKAELGLEKIPALTLLLDDNPNANKLGEYFQTILTENLGIELKIDKQIFKQRLQKSRAGDFDLLFAGWGPDYNDPMTFADLFASWNQNNRGQFKDPMYDTLITEAQAITDQNRRAAIFGQLQTILSDKAVILPAYESGDIYVQNPGLKNVKRQVIGGDPIFTYAEIE